MVVQLRASSIGSPASLAMHAQRCELFNRAESCSINRSLSSQAFASVMEELFQNPEVATRMGLVGQQHVKKKKKKKIQAGRRSEDSCTFISTNYVTEHVKMNIVGQP